MSTPITEFREAVRSLVGDLDTPARYTNATVDQVIRTVLETGRMEDYALQAGRLEVVPSVTDPNDWFLLSANAALLLARGRPDSFAWSTRDFSQRVSGASRALVLDLNREIKKAEGRTLFVTWQDFGTWMDGLSGISPRWRNFVRLRVRSPIGTITIP